ncbi:sirohydrochlorin chelatase [Corynebacterium sp. zg-331]|uniref:sirohydrochlorin chelatase n=1 Tax=unclassified Corynebacterium TaxID=2624378 RepID=UPI00128E7AD5|nr:MULTISPECIES: CbiX/SirB N-terminal domain-containing protein [unclassified Corynebacterium]MBC3185795.1 sirohydrochlorin chelatase [Corynebacterium sp. zg-331]MPV52288.1 sirohydrochlorin chelatase [Corynebacterium sp. zg331]
MTLLTLAHGSRHPESPAAVEAVTAAAGARLGVPAAASYLELQRPDLASAATRAAGAGARSAVVVPLLFTRAYHVKNDVPAAAARAAGSGLSLTLAAPLGLGEDVARLLAGIARAEAAPRAHLVLYAVGSSDTAANREVENLGRRVAHATGLTLSVVYATRGGVAALAREAARHQHLHVLPLFVAPGLLLDLAMAALPGIRDNTGARISASAPLGARLAPLVAARYRAAVAESCPERDGRAA